MAFVLTLDEIDRTSVLLRDTLVIEHQAADFISTCSLTLYDAASSIKINAEDSITVVDTATYFSGRVADVSYERVTRVARMIHIKCQDKNYQLSETIVDNTEEYSAMADSAIIDDLFDTYLPGVDSETHVDTIQDPLTITIEPTTLRSALSQICTHSGGYFYLDFDNKLHYFSEENEGISWWLTSNPAVDVPATNCIKNPSIETDTSFLTEDFSTISRDGVFSLFDDYSLKIVTNDWGSGEGVHSDVSAETSPSTTYTFSVYLRGSGTVRLWVFDNIAGQQNGSPITLTDDWVRHSITKTFSTGADRWVGVWTSGKQGVTFYCDGLMLEASSVLSSYFDGSFGSDFAWTGIAHLSTSTRGSGARSYLLKDTSMESTATTRLDGVFVIGAGVEGWRGTHAPGDRQALVRDNRIETTAGLNARGDAILGKYGNKRDVYTVSTYETGLNAGNDVLFICDLYDVNEILTVRKALVRWDPAGTVYFTFTLGDVVNPSLISQRIWVDTIDGSLRPITAPRLPTSSKGWSHSLTFSATDNDTVAWTGGNIYLADGTIYAIDAGNTANMAQATYIYLDLDTSETVLQKTVNPSVAVGAKKILIAWAKNQAVGLEATFFVFGGSGQNPLIDTDNIVDDAITTDKILANTILAGDIAAATITTNEIAANTILAGNIAAGAIKTDELDALAVTAAKIAANTITADKISMGMGDGLFNLADGLLLLGPHCEITPTTWTSLRKQVAVISGAFHQEAGRWMGTRGLVVEKATTNLILNPSIEVDTTGWLGIGATVSRDTAYSMFGAASLKVITDNGASNERTYSIVTAQTAPDTEYTFSAYVRGSGTVRPFMYDENGSWQFGSVHTLNGTWTRIQMTKTFSDGTIRLVGVATNVQQGITFYCDGFQLEQKDYTTSYCDGTLGTGYAWTGTAHGSTSTRAITEVNLDDHVELISGNPTLSFRIVAQMPYDADATWPEPFYNVLFDLFATGDRLMLYYNPVDDKFTMRIDVTNRLLSAAQTFNAGDWMDILVTLDFTADEYYLYINGLESDSDTTAMAAQTATQWNLGSSYTGLAQGGFVIAEFTAFDRVLTAIEAAGMYALQRPMIDMGSLDKPGLYILDGKFQVASSTSGSRISITPEEIAGYDSGGTKQFYLQASDGKAMAGGGGVRLDANGLYMIGSGATDDLRRLRFLYDDSGTERLMGHVYGNYGGSGASYSWLTAWRQTGDPWTGAKVILAAIDNVAATDIRITVDSAGTVSIGGDLLTVSDAVQIGGDLTIGGDIDMNGSKMEVNDNFWAGIAGPAERIVFDTGGYIDVQGARFGVNVGGVPEAQVDFIGTGAAIPVLLLEQTDLSEDFIRFKATVGAGNPVDTTTALGAYYGRVRVSVWGVAGFKYLALYNP